MAYWLFKTEADAWSWDEQKKKGAAGEEWTGVRNFQARGNMRKMKKGDRGFFYHTGDEKQVVGIVEVIKEAHPESKDAGVGVRRPEGRRRRAEAGDARGDQGRAEAEGHGAGQELAPLGAAGQRRGVGARLQDGRRRSGEAEVAGAPNVVPDLRRQSAPPSDALRHLGDHRRSAFSSILWQVVARRRRRAARRLKSRHDPGAALRLWRAAARARHRSRLGDDPHLDVHARRLAASRRQHALPLDFRRQHRRLDGARPLPRLLSPLRHGRRARRRG